MIERVKIGIIGLGEGSGTGLIASCLARAMTEVKGLKPAVLELGYGGLYECLGMAKRFTSDEFFPFHHMVARDRSIRGRINDYEGVNWMLLPEEKNFQLDFSKKLRLIHSAMGNVILCRLNGVNPGEIWKLLWQMDEVLVVIDPLPSRVLSQYNFLCKLRTSDLPLTHVVNKYNPGINRRELLRFINCRNLHYLPWIPPEAIYGAEYTCRIVYDMPLGKKLLKKPLKALIEDLLLNYDSIISRHENRRT